MADSRGAQNNSTQKDSNGDHESPSLEQEANVAANISSSTQASNITGKRKGSRNPSIVWEYFEKLPCEKKDDQVARCLKCGDELKCPPRNGTTSLRNHVDRCYKNWFDSTDDKKQQFLSFKKQISGDGSGGVVNWKFDQESCRKALIRMIIVDELPFKMVERDGFHHFMSVVQPKFQVPSRITMARDCLKLYLQEKASMKKFLNKKAYRVCLTTDTWTSIQNLSYMCLTVHFIDEEWNLHKRILNFRPIHSHKGEEVGKAIEKCLQAWGIDKVFTITVDNAYSNDVSLSYLKRKMKDGSVLNGEYLHMRCCAHIINLVVKDGLKEIDDSIVRIRGAVRYIRSSPSRLRKFKDSVAAVKIDCKSLLCLDVETRWNSTFLMLDTACKFQKAFDNLRDHDLQYKFDLMDKDGVPTDEDWAHARIMVHFLQHFYETTTRVSGSLYVTANNFFHEIYGIEAALNEIKDSDDAHLKYMAEKMKGKYEKYWGNVKNMNVMLFIAVILDPRYKFDYVKWSFENSYGVEKGAEMTKLVECKLFAMFEEYSTNSTSSMGQTSMVVDVGEEQKKNTTLLSSGTNSYKIQKLYKKHKFQEKGYSVKYELERYLTENFDDDNDDDDAFDILNWWRVNSVRYRVLSMMARDVLAVPISTVASESAFSTGGRVLDTFRSSLTPLTVEALICAQDWFRAAPLLSEVEERIDELELIESEFSGASKQTSVNVDCEA